MIGTLNTATLASTGTLDLEVSRWKASVENDGGEASRETLEALNTFISNLKLNKIRNKITRCNLFCGSNYRSAMHPIIISDLEEGKSLGYDKDKNYGFFDSDYSESSGLTATGAILNNQASKYLDTGLFLTSAGMSESYGHLSFMSTNQSVNLNSIGGYMMPICGGNYSLASALSSYIEFNSDKTLKAASPSSFIQGSTKGHVEVENVDEIGGYWLANRTSRTNQNLYKDSIQFDNADATADQADNIIGGYRFRVFGAYSGGQVTQTNAYKLLFYSIGKTLTENEIEILNQSLVQFNETLNRI
tara:strand:+ start:12179 stop:13087 length:909 start_codon:yes stop_codon:yes gene_type:complete